MFSLFMSKLCICSVVTIFIYLMFKYNPALAFSSFTFIRSCFKSLLLSAGKMVPSTYLKLIFLSSIFTLPFTESSPVFQMICSANRLNKQGDKMYPCLSPSYRKPLSLYILSFIFFLSCFSIFCAFLSTVQVTNQDNQGLMHAHFFQSNPQFFMIHTDKGFTEVFKTE